MENILTILCLIGMSYGAFRFVRFIARTVIGTGRAVNNATKAAIGAGRAINTRFSDTITCGNCSTKLPTTTQIPCEGCGFTKTRNLVSACPNCNRTAQFVNCPNCGDSIKFA